jgi:hypothetical protein
LRIGGLNRSERISKINRLIEIEQHLNENNLLETNQVNDLEKTLNFKIPPYFVNLLQQAEEAKLTKGKK